MKKACGFPQAKGSSTPAIRQGGTGNGLHSIFEPDHEVGVFKHLAGTKVFDTFQKMRSQGSDFRRRANLVLHILTSSLGFSSQRWRQKRQNDAVQRVLSGGSQRRNNYTAESSAVQQFILFPGMKGVRSNE